MLEGFVQIGKALLKEGNLISNLIEEVPTTRNNKPLQILKLNFKGDGLEVDISEEMSDDSAEKYLFIGSADGPNSPQWFATSKTVNYFLTETFYNLTNIDFGEKLNKKIKEVFDKFYINLEGDIKNSKYRYVLDLKKYLNTEREVRDIYSELKRNKKEDKEIVKELLKEFEGYLKKKFDIKLNEIGLFTIFINDVPLVSYKEYQEKLLEAKKPKSIEAKRRIKEGKEQICSICGSTENITSDLSKMKIKYYTTNQVIFANNIDTKNYYKNMQICENCMNSLLSGEVYVKNKLDTKLGDFRVYLIPHFIYGEPLNKDELDHAIEKINKSFNIAKNLKDIENFEKDIFESLDLREEKSYFMLNFVFYKQSQQATKIQRLIKDVAPTIFAKIGEASKSANMKMREALNKEDYGTYIGLQNIYFMIPVKVKKGDVTEYRDLLDIYDTVLTGRQIKKRHLIDKFVDAVNVIRLGKEGYNIKSNRGLEFYLLDANMMIKFFEYLGCLKGGNGLDISTLKVKDEIKAFIEKMGYDEQESAMFLLGYLIGEIGNAQYKRLDGNKPILNKLNFNGIDKTKILRLCNEIFGKLKQEKIRGYNEIIYFELKRLIDSNINSWKLNKNENLFYILSGYSFSTAQLILKEGKENEQ